MKMPYERELIFMQLLSFYQMNFDKDIMKKKKIKNNEYFLNIDKETL
jgi:hypothetical protein